MKGYELKDGKIIEKISPYLLRKKKTVGDLCYNEVDIINDDELRYEI
jgi:hypothetical protein